MTPYQQIVDQIQRMLATEGDPEPIVLQDQVREYTHLVDEINKRLRICEGLLHTGHRAEALQECETPPNVLEAVSHLDFSQREEWVDYLSEFDIPQPPQLLMDIAADLNDAYTDEEPLKDLMRRHRRAALACSPLSVRIAIMRKIAHMDQSNSVWTKDLKTFEHARHNELQAEATIAVRNRDVSAVAALEKELRDPAWLLPPKPSLVKNLTKAHADLRSQQARKELTAIEKDLTAAFSDFDIDQARRLRGRWLALVAICELPPHDELAELAAPALEWLEQRDREEADEHEYNTLVSQLEHQLDHSAERMELERTYHALVRLERDIPEVLEHRLSERFHADKIQAQRKHRLTVTGVVLGTMLLAGVVGLFVVRHVQATEAANFVTSLRALYDEGKHNELETQLATLKDERPDIHESAGIQKLIADLVAAQHKAADRQSAFAAALAEADRLGVVEGDWDTFSSATEAINRALELASTDGEEAEVHRVRGRIDAKRRELQSAVDDVFLKDFTVLKERGEILPPGDTAAIKTLRDEAIALSEKPRVSNVHLENVKPFIAQLNGQIDRILEGEQRAYFLDRIGDVVGNKTGYVQRLRDYAEKFPNESRSGDFQKVVQEVALWDQAKLWSPFVSQWSRLNLAHQTPGQAAALKKQAEGVISQVGQFPGADRVKELLPYLDAIIARGEGQSAIALQLYDPLNHPFVNGLFMVDAGNERYYSLKEPRKSLGENWSVNYLPELDVSEKKLKLLDKADIRNRLLGDAYDWTSPQTRFSKATLDRLAKIDHTNWESTFLTSIRELRESERMDPVLQLQLLENLQAVATQGSLPLAKVLERDMLQLKNSQLDPTVNWVDPENVDGIKARQVATGILKRLQPLDEIDEGVKAELKPLNQPSLGPTYQWVGWLVKDINGEWQARLSRQKIDRRTGEPTVLLPSANNGPVLVETVGVFRDGQVELMPNASGLAEGRPIFLKTER